MQTDAPKRLATRLTAVGERHLKSGHPWLYDGSIENIKGTGCSGDLAIIFDRRRDKFLGIGLYDPDSPIRIKVLHQGGSVRIDEQFFQQRMLKAKAIRATLLETDTNSYRFINGENDGFPGLIADCYASVLVVKIYSLIWAPWFQTILPLLLAVSGCSSVVLRLSRRVSAHSEKPASWVDGKVVYGQLETAEVVFKEHGLRLKANVLHGHKTGFFLDHRYNRKRVGELASGRRVLDVFSYAGGFSVHALAGGAAAVTALDISEQALSVARENVALNFDAPDFLTLAGDAFVYLGKLAAKNLTYDLIVVDPPAFAKKEREVEGALRAYERLTRMAVKLLSPGGILMTASCSSRISAPGFFALQTTTLSSIGRKWEEMERSLHDIDHPVIFPEGNYLKSIYFRFP